MLVTLACGQAAPGKPPSNAVILEVAANTSLSAWLKAAVQDFNAEKVKGQDGKQIYVVVEPIEAGQAVLDITAGQINPALWIPDNSVWIEILVDQGQGAYQTAFQEDCTSLASSPLVIGMWRPVAEALGWPGSELGWLDIGSLAADPSAWDYYSGGQFGSSLRLGHTHPGLSGSGASTLLAVVQSAQSKVDAVNVVEIQQPVVQASVSAFEGAVSWFSSDTDTLGSTMRARGVNYLGAAVMYESSVIQYSDGELQIVPIYPFEGTYMATHPACLNATLDQAQREAAVIFRNYLLGETAQRLALANGLRPVNPLVAPGAPLDAAHGVDLTRPIVTFELPSVDTVFAIQSLWQSSRKGVNLVMQIDTSGSMQGEKLRSVQEAAVQFVNQMGDRDYLTLIAFSQTNVVTLIDHQQIGIAREQAAAAIRGLSASGSTPLYDALGYGAQVIQESASSQTTNAIVVLTDGKDTSSQSFDFNQDLINGLLQSDATIFTIAYGSDADETLLSDLALRANGNFYLGDEASIAAIYDEMSAAFGGSVGIGR